MEDLQKRIGYTFKNTDLLTEALTHSSYANEHKAKHIKYNERLEFLGDAVLSIVVSDYIFKHCPELPEGELTKLRASLVCEKTLFAQFFKSRVIVVTVAVIYKAVGIMKSEPDNFYIVLFKKLNQL